MSSLDPGEVVRVRWLSLALFASIVVAVAAQVPDVVSAAPAVYDSEFAEAEATGERVELVDERTATDTVYANPSGTVTRETASAPVRVFQDGDWTPVDLTLEVRGGVVVPRAAPFGVEFSGGGDADLASVEIAGVTTSTSWTGDLPEPQLDGATATYPGVLEGVDLKMSVTDGGVRQVLVVHDEEAASNSALNRLELPVAVDGGDLRERAGGLQVIDEVGREVGRSPAPTMWDSSGTVMADQHDPVQDSSAEAIEQRTTGPAPGDDVSGVSVDVADDALVLKPDPDALTGDDVSYPVYVDPASSPSAYRWAMAFKEHSGSSFYKWTDSNGQAVGYQTYTGISTKRLFFQYDLKAVRGTRILNATLRARMLWSASCDDFHPTRVYKVGGFDGSLTWNKQPEWRQHLASGYGAAWYGCNEGGDDVTWNVTSGVQESADKRYDAIALGLRAADESNPRAWRRFAHTTRLSIEYNRPPSTPSGTMVNNLPCNSTNSPVLGRMTKLPRMSAKVTDPDTDDLVRARIGTSVLVDRDKPELGKKVIIGAYGARGRTVVHDFPLDKQPTDTVKAGEHRFEFVAEDEHGARSATAPKCVFRVDDTLPAQPELTSFPEGVIAPGVTIPVAVGSGDGEDTTGYASTIDSDTRPTSKRVNAASDGSASFSLPAQTAGLHTLRTWAFDQANNPSGLPLVKRFEVVEDRQRWSFGFDEASGDAAGANDYPNEPAINPFTVGTASRLTRAMYIGSNADEPVIDRMLSITPQTSSLPRRTYPVIEIDRSFSVGAYLDPAAVEGTQSSTMTALSFGTASTPVIELNARPTEDGFAYRFRLRSANGTWHETELVDDDNAPGTVLVLASYDALEGEMKIRVKSHEYSQEAAAPDSVAFSPPTSSANVWTIGSTSTGAQRWNGYVDRVWMARFAAGERHVDDLVTAAHFPAECVRTGVCDQ